LPKPVIEVENLKKKYIIGMNNTLDLRSFINNIFSNKKDKNQSIWALDGISFNVEKGEILGLIGPNGSGKSTLLKILSKITYPTSGKARIRGKVSSLLEVGTGFHPELTGRENIYLNGSLLGMQRNEIKKKFDEIVDFSGVEFFLDTPVKHYSSGMYIRLAFSIAAHLEPEVLLVDEVLSVGDLYFKQKSLDKMNEVSSMGRTILFVSHDLDAIQKICKKGILLKEGKINFEGKINDVINTYKNRSPIENPFKSDKKQINRKISLDNFDLFDSLGNKTNNVSSGDRVRLSIGISSELFVKNIRIRLAILNTFGEIVFELNNYLSGDRIDLQKGSNKITCEIEKLPLNKGKYIIDFWFISENNYHIAKACFFTVDSSIYYKTGNLPYREIYTLVDHSWYYEKEYKNH
jgi:lipopolysaccharide transport system ATP-binding protein